MTVIDNESGKRDHRHFGATQSEYRFSTPERLMIDFQKDMARWNSEKKAVHADITALLNAGVLDRAEGGGIVFPFEAGKVEFLLEAA